MSARQALPSLLTLTATALAACACASPCLAEPSWGELLRNHPADPGRTQARPVARYVTEDGDAFVLDRSSGVPLLKFEDSPEIWVLNASIAPRGDIIYRDDLGQPVLRATRMGGLILFNQARAGGVPAALAGIADSIRLHALDAAALLQRLSQASVKASRAARRLIVFEAPDVTPGAEAVYADGAAVTAEAFTRLSQRKNGHLSLARIQRVQLTQGVKSAAGLENGVLKVILNPRRGLAGRPSSRKILAALH